MWAGVRGISRTLTSQHADGINAAATNAATKLIPAVIIQRLGNLGTKSHFAIAEIAANFASAL